MGVSNCQYKALIIEWDAVHFCCWEQQRKEKTVFTSALNDSIMIVAIWLTVFPSIIYCKKVDKMSCSFASYKYGFSHPQNIIGPHFRHHTYVTCVHVEHICTIKSVSTRARAVVLHAISPISMELCQFKGSTPKLKKTEWSLFWFFRGEIDHPPSVFLGFHQGNRLKIGKMYEALTTMVFNQLLWGFAHILLHP